MLLSLHLWCTLFSHTIWEENLWISDCMNLQCNKCIHVWTWIIPEFNSLDIIIVISKYLGEEQTILDTTGAV